MLHTYRQSQVYLYTHKHSHSHAYTSSHPFTPMCVHYHTYYTYIGKHTSSHTPIYTITQLFPKPSNSSNTLFSEPLFFKQIPILKGFYSIETKRPEFRREEEEEVAPLSFCHRFKEKEISRVVFLSITLVLPFIKLFMCLALSINPQKSH